MKLTSGPQQPGDTRATTTIRSRLTGVVVVPSVILLVMWAVFSSYTVFDGIYLKAVASGVKDASIPGLNAFSALQRERQLTMAVLNSSNPDTIGLENQQRTTDRAVADLQAAMGELAANAPAEISVKVQALNDVLGPLDQRRAQVSAGNANADEIYRYYNSLMDGAAELFDTQARIVPDPIVLQEAMDAVSMFRAGDDMSRASSLASAAIAAGRFTPAQHVEFTSLVGSYRAALATVAPAATDRVREMYRQLTGGEAWQRLAAAEARLIGSAPTPPPDPDQTDGEPEEVRLPVTAADWQNLTSRVSEELIKITSEQSSAAVQLGLDRADAQFTEVIIGSLIALLAVVGGIVMAVRISRRLVNKALVTRLEQLKNDSLRLAHERLPTLVDRLRAGDRVDVAAEVPRSTTAPTRSARWPTRSTPPSTPPSPRP
ncbi:nitrate- and nitrite sensing domain-containing protein [Actinokineospora soli]|uniref:Nitrate- and nitrite sensing domain-containing protein n=1 Tax=Actinokineospora soli TaxID=1048753 RepID=A0ABW2TQF7_9PSEU